jgi:hypothetical protein
MELAIAGTGEVLRFTPRALIIAGFTGRSRAKVEEHIAEMRAHGVPIPDRVPTFYPVPIGLLTVTTPIEVATPESSGEAEPVLIARGEEWYVAVGSDHTARDLEKDDIAQSKAACPKVLGKEAWRYADVREHWDRIGLKSWAVRDGKRIRYQDGTCADILPPEEIVRQLREREPGVPGEFVMCLGTLPLLTGGFVYASRYELALEDPVRGRRLALNYDVRVREKTDAKAGA